MVICMTRLNLVTKIIISTGQISHATSKDISPNSGKLLSVQAVSSGLKVALDEQTSECVSECVGERVSQNC